MIELNKKLKINDKVTLPDICGLTKISGDYTIIKHSINKDNPKLNYYTLKNSNYEIAFPEKPLQWLLGKIVNTEFFTVYDCNDYIPEHKYENIVFKDFDINCPTGHFSTTIWLHNTGDKCICRRVLCDLPEGKWQKIKLSWE